jgi:ABC-type phosphate/phosphonate transport system ATPase subunit
MKTHFRTKYNLIPGVDYIKYLAQDFNAVHNCRGKCGEVLSNLLPIKKLRIQELLEMVEMTEYAKVKAKDLSGGQQQRVALAKVLALSQKFYCWMSP